MGKQELIALYKSLNKLIGISDPDSPKIEAISYTMQIVKEELLNRHDMFISIERP